MTGKPGRPPGWVMARCSTGWAIRDDAAKRMPAAARMNNGIGLDTKALLRFMM
jgi:hypothetical protein